MKLWVIGNGFDLYHGLPTSYEDFYNFIRKQRNNMHMINFMELVVSQANTESYRLWSNFEENLGKIDIGKLNQFRNQHHVNGQIWSKYVVRLHDEFCRWANSITQHQVEQTKILNCFSSEDRFITFNYTDTLERVYGIDDQHLLHIHGKATDKASIKIGHNYRPQQQMPRDKYDYLFATYKNTKRIYQENNAFFQSLYRNREITDIYVLGCSFSSVDKCYFRHLESSIRNCNWHISLHNFGLKDTMLEKAITCEIAPNRIEFLEIGSLKL